jgi:hypothetical protein
MYSLIHCTYYYTILSNADSSIFCYIYHCAKWSFSHLYLMYLLAKSTLPLNIGKYNMNLIYIRFTCTVLPRSIAPRFIANRQNSHLSRFPPLNIPRYTAKLSYCHPPQVFRHKSHKTNLNSPVSTAHNYLLTPVYWSVIMECQNWSSDTVIDLIVEGRNRWLVVLIRMTTCIYFSSDYICTFNPE